MDDKVRAQIQNAIENNEVLLFMKGTRQAPSCGFSARTVEVLDSLMGSYSTVDVLSHPEVREGIKEFSSWPTIPQLYVRGEFVGGADIIGQMFESGELHTKLGLAGADAKAPNVTISDKAAEAFRSFIGESDEIVLLEISREFEHALSVGPMPKSALVCESQGITVALDRLSATRAEGLHVDYVETPEGSAFKLNNPNEPAKVKQLSVAALKAKMDRGEALRLIDVRRPDEWATAKIEGAELLDSDLMDALLEEPQDTMIVFQCHHGHRSQRVAEQLVEQGYRSIFNLAGGIDAWSQEVDSGVPRY